MSFILHGPILLFFEVLVKLKCRQYSIFLTVMIANWREGISSVRAPDGAKNV